MSQVQEMSKEILNIEGNFHLIKLNSIHSPDSSVEETVNELQILLNMGIFQEKYKILNSVVDTIVKYKSFEYLKFI